MSFIVAGEFELRKNPLSVRSALVPSMRWLAIFSCATNILLLAPPLHMLQVYDRVLSSQSQDTLIYITTIAVIALAIYGVGELVRGLLAQRLSARFATAYSDDVFRATLQDGLPYPQKAELVRNLSKVRVFLAGRAFIGLFDLPFMPFFLLLLFLLHPTLGLIGLVGILALIGTTYLNKKLAEPFRAASERSSSEAMGFAQAVLSRSDDTRAMGLLPSLISRWGGMTVKVINNADQMAHVSSGFYGLAKFVRQGLQIGIMAWGAYLVIQGDMSGGMIFASSMILGRALMPIEQLLGAWDSAMDAREAYRSLQALEQLPQKKQIRLPEPEGRLTVEELTYTPGDGPKAAPVVNDISFRLDPGKILIVIGPSGGGKSTLARLIVGAISPTSGCVRLDGFELDQWPDQQRAEAIGYVPQDIQLFPVSIAENIARMNPRPDDEKVVAAAQLAGVHDMIAALPDGYTTKLGPGGAMLSGGQRQRIALARAFYQMPRILVLDEPNAHLDDANQELLIAALLKARDSGITIFCITQRKSLVGIADHVMVIEGGQITQYQDRPGTVARPTSMGNHGAQQRDDSGAHAQEPAGTDTPPQMPPALIEALRKRGMAPGGGRFAETPSGQLDSPPEVAAAHAASDQTSYRLGQVITVSDPIDQPPASIRQPHADMRAQSADVIKAAEEMPASHAPDPADLSDVQESTSPDMQSGQPAQSAQQDSAASTTPNIAADATGPLPSYPLPSRPANNNNTADPRELVDRINRLLAR